MIRTFAELDRFILVDVPADFPGRILYAYIPEIGQIQAIAHESKYVADPSPVWRVSNGHRTTLEKLPLRYTVSVEISEIGRAEAIALCPAAVARPFSTLMIEDLGLRSQWKLENLRRLKLV